MNRITEKQIQARIDYLNKLTGNPETPWTRLEDRNKANIGNYHLSGAYGGVCVNQMHNESGGVTCPLGSYHRPKRELFDALNAFIAGIEMRK